MKKIKRLTALLLALTMLLSLAACGSSDKGSGSPNSGSSAAANGGGDKKPDGGGNKTPAASQQLPLASHVQNAMEAAKRLGTGLDSRYFIAGDGSLFTYELQDEYNGYVGDYAALPDLKELVFSAYEANFTNKIALALTGSGKLYYKDDVLLEGVRGAALETITHHEPYAAAITDNAIYYGKVNEGLEDWTEAFKEYGVKPVSGSFGNFSYVVMENYDVFILYDNGKVYLWSSGSTHDEEYRNLDFFDWENMAMIGSAMVTSDKIGPSLTVAGVQADGTVKAVGDYADEILSWGELSAISMHSKLIAGLTPEGKIKVAGQWLKDADRIVDEIDTLQDIIAVKVDYKGSVITALGADGTYYEITPYAINAIRPGTGTDTPTIEQHFGDPDFYSGERWLRVDSSGSWKRLTSNGGSYAWEDADW